MIPTVYRNFDLRLEPTTDNRYKVSVSSDCGGDATETFTLGELDFDSASAGEQKESTERNATLASESETNQVSLINVKPPSLLSARAFGRQLFKAIFKGSVSIALDRCMTREPDNTQLRIRLNLTSVPDLAGLPWELLCSVSTNNFLAKSYGSIVRYLESDLPYDDSLLTKPPLRILVVASDPQGVSKLDVAGEVANLKDAVKELEAKQRIVLDVLDKPTRRALSQRLHERRNSAPYHVFHFIGHGVFDSFRKEGKLLLENEARGSSPFSAQELGEMLAAHRSFRLAVINACEGARTSPSDSYSGVAQTFLRSGAAPVVIAMQYRISDDAAKIFSQNFYEALLKGDDMDTAVAWARMSVSDSEPKQQPGDDDPVEWGTPVLYMRARDSRLVDFPEGGHEGATEIESRPIGGATDPLDEDYQAIVKALLGGQLVPFLGLDVNLFDRWETSRPLAYAELVERLTKFSQYPYNPGAPLAGVSQYAQLPDKLATLYDELAPLFNDRKYKPTLLHEFWARVAKERTQDRTELDPKRRRFIIVTTNYDELLEQAFEKTVEQFYVFSYIADGGDQGKFFRTLYQNGAAKSSFLVDVSTKELTDELPIILKLPGTIGEFDSRIRFAITEDQYFDLLTNRELTSILPSQVMTKLRGCHHLFLGYNVSDWNTRGILYRIWEKHTPRYDSWVVNKEGLSEFESRYWRACQVKIIDESLARFVAELERRMPQWRGPGGDAPDS